MSAVAFIVAGVTMIAIFALALTDRRIAIALLLALLPTYVIRFILPVPLFGTLPTTLLELLFWAVFLGWLFTDARRGGALHKLRSWTKPLILLLVGVLIGVLAAPDLRGALGVARAYFIEPLLFFIMAADVFRASRNRDAAIFGLGVTTSVIGIVAIVQKITGIGIANPFWQAEATRRVTAFYGFPNAIGLFVAPITVILIVRGLALLRSRTTKQSSFAGITFAAATLGIIAALFAVSEGALIGIIAGLIFYGLLEKRFRIPALVAIIAGSIAIAVVPPLTRYATGVLSLTDDSGRVRRIVWSDTAAMLRDHPVFGAGLSGYPARVAPYHTAVGIELFQYPHDVILNFWSETGLIGLAGFLAIVALLFIHARQLRHARPDEWVPSAAMAAMVTLLIHGLVDVPYFKNDLALLFWMVIALVEGARIETGQPGFMGALRKLFGRDTV